MPNYDSEPPVFFDSGIVYDEPGQPSRTERRVMAKILRNWSKRGISQRIAFGADLAQKLEDNPTLVPNPAPSLATLKAASGAATTADALVADLEGQLKAARADRITKSDALMLLVDQYASSAEGATGGDSTKLITLGFEMVGEPQPAGPLTQVTNMVLSAGDDDGTLDAMWDPQPGAIEYELQLSDDPNVPSGWSQYEIVPRSSLHITGQTSGHRRWARVRARGRSGPGPWSDPATKMVP